MVYARARRETGDRQGQTEVPLLKESNVSYGGFEKHGDLNWMSKYAAMAKAHQMNNPPGGGIRVLLLTEDTDRLLRPYP